MDKKQLSFREIFTAVAILFWWFSVFLRARVRVEKFSWSPVQLQQLPEQAPIKVKPFKKKLLGSVFVSFVLMLWVFASGEIDSAGKIPAGKEAKSMEETIMSMEKGAMKRWQNGDPWGWAEISAPELTYIDPNITKHIEGLEEYKKYLKQFEGKVNYQGSEFIDPKIVVQGHTAVLTYNYKSTKTGTDGSIINQTLWNSTEVYCLLDGKWKIIHTHWSYVRQKLPQRTEVPILVEMSLKIYDGVAGKLMALESAAMERWRKGDPWGFTEISAPEVTYFDTGTPSRLDGLEALKAEYAKREGKIRYDIMEFIAPKVQLHGDAAVLSYRFFSTHVNPDGSIASRIPWNCTEVFFKIDGKWKIIHTHWSFIKGTKNSGVSSLTVVDWSPSPFDERTYAQFSTKRNR